MASMACTGLVPESARRRRWIFFSSSSVKRSSSRRVPDLRMSMAGKMAVGQLPGEMELHVPGALELLEDDVVHPGARLDQDRPHDRERPTLLELTGGPEEGARHLEGAAVDAAGHGASSRAQLVVVRARHAREGVEEDEHVPLLEHQALGLLEDLLGHLDVAAVGVVVARGDDLRRLADGHPEIRHLLGALIYQENDDDYFGVVGEHCLGDTLQQHGLPRPRLGDDEPPLAPADRRDQVKRAHGQLGRRGLELQPLVGLDRCEALEARGRGGRRRHP